MERRLFKESIMAKHPIQADALSSANSLKRVLKTLRVEQLLA
jgi:hypothetical protein